VETAVSTTRAVLIESFEDEPHLAERALPALADGDVLIRVAASSINAFDWKAAEGRFKEMFEYAFPVTIGRDYAGVVEAVGAGVERVAPGDEVVGYFTGMRLGQGAYAERIAVPDGDCFTAKPEELSFVDAACLPLCAMVAYRCVDAVDPKPGEWHLVLGAPGGVGSYAVQLLAARGAQVIASGHPEDEAYLRDLGAAAVVDHRGGLHDAVRAVRPGGIDGLVDLVSYAPELVANAALLVRGGRVASLHRAASPEALEPLGVVGTNVGSQADTELLARIVADAASGRLRVPVQRTFAFEEAPQALAVLKNEHARGKLALLVGEAV
jgi:NADPH:quinone reductase-like Zn-dependent oxidoreductase